MKKEMHKNCPITNSNQITVKPVYSGYLRFLKKVSAITRCPLYRVLDFLSKKKTTTTEIKMEDFFNTIRVNNINEIYFQIERYF